MWIWIPTRPGIMGQMLCLCDGEIRLHAGRWTKYESSEASAEGNVAMALEKQTRLGLLSSTIHSTAFRQDWQILQARQSCSKENLN